MEAAKPAAAEKEYDRDESSKTVITEDEQAFMWLTGVPDGARVIVQGQDFVREGIAVDAVDTAAEKSAQR